MQNLKSNFVFILGGSSGIGKAILEKLAAELKSSTIVFTWRRESALEKIDLESFVKNGNNVISQELDTAKDFEGFEDLDNWMRNCERVIFVACAFDLGNGFWSFEKL